MRNAAVAGAHDAQVTDEVSLTASQRQALQSLVAESDGISRSLAADDVGQFKAYFARLAAVLPFLRGLPMRMQTFIRVSSRSIFD